MDTRALYLEDSLLSTFTARVVDRLAAPEGQSFVVLDRTAFYPESGGQHADQGSLGGFAVLDVQRDEAGRIRHLVDGLPPAGAELEGRLNMELRRLHMALHTGQHLLSQALLRLAGAATRSSRLGRTACTLDVTARDLPPEVLRSAEELVNAIVAEDRPVRAFFPGAFELEGLALRRPPQVDRDVRVVEVAGFDQTPCGGTHCTRTGQVGLLLITSAEHYKGATRVTFAAGDMARALAARQRDLLRELGLALCSDAESLPARLAALQSDLQAARQAAQRDRDALALALAQMLLRSHEGGLVVAELEADRDLLRRLGQRITAAPGHLALLAGCGPAGGAPSGLEIVCARSNGVALDCGAFLASLAARLGGRGGGRADHAEGRLPAVDWQTEARAALPSTWRDGITPRQTTGGDDDRPQTR